MGAELWNEGRGSEVSEVAHLGRAVIGIFGPAIQGGLAMNSAAFNPEGRPCRESATTIQTLLGTIDGVRGAKAHSQNGRSLRATIRAASAKSGC
jgi:hypothetical protein